MLLEALPALRRRVPEARLVVVGDSFLRPWLERRLSGREREHVIFAGSVPPAELASYYASSHVAVSPATRNESFGIVLLEAMASGKALVASDIPGYRAVVEHGGDGLLVPPGDAPALAAALAALLRDPARRLAFGARGRAKAEAYSWPAVTDRLEAYYREVLAGDARAS